MPEATASTKSNVIAPHGGELIDRTVSGDEAAALAKGTLLQASLEIYAPLTDATMRRGAPIENRAQSLSALVLEAGAATHLAR